MRKNKSLLNDWIKTQPYTTKEIAAKLNINYGTLIVWLDNGYVPRTKMMHISKKTGISWEKLVAEYNKAKR